MNSREKATFFNNFRAHYNNGTCGGCVLTSVLQLFKKAGGQRRRRSNRETRVCCVEREPSSRSHCGIG